MKHIILPVAMAVAGVAVAEGSELTDTTRVLGEVTVVESAAKAPVALMPLDVRTIDNQTIERSRENNILPVLQNRIPGMFVTERSLAGYGVSGGAAGAVSIRGIGGGGRVLFMIDGQPQWAGIFGHSLPDTYVTNDIERVEVVSGPSSMLYGSGAMGGSVNLITRRATADGFSGSLRAMGGSYATQNYAAKAGWHRGGLRLFAAASYESTDGNRRGMGYRLANQYISASYDISRHWEAGVNAMFTETKADNAGSDQLEQPLAMWSKMLRTTASLYVKNRYDVSSGGLQVYYNWGRHKIDDGLSNGQPRDYLFNSRDFNMGATLYQTVKPWRGNNLSAGVDFKHWGGMAFNALKSDGSQTQIVDKHVTEIAGYAMMQQSLFRDRLNVNAGVRLEHSSQFGDNWVPQAGFIWRMDQNANLKFNYGKGFRSPNIRELYMYAPRNPELRPESLDNFELELRKWFFSSRLNVGVAGYYIKGENLIQTIMVDGAAKNVNSGKFKNMGFELDATLSISNDWEVTANYAWLHTKTLIVGAPAHKLFGQVSFTPGNWEFSVDILGIWDLQTEESKESYALLNARAAYTFAFRQPLTLFVKGDNLTATKYQINYGFPMPRATVMAAIEWRF